MSGSRTTIANTDRLPNVHPGDILRDDFMIGSELPLAEVVEGTGIERVALEALIAAKQNVDASLDARLTRYLGMSDGFFLRLQNSYDLEKVRHSDREALDRIVPRAA